MKEFDVTIEVTYMGETCYVSYYEKCESEQELRDIVQQECNTLNKETDAIHKIYEIKECGGK